MDNEEYYHIVATTFAAANHSGKAPWLHDHKAGERELPHNPVTGVVYNNVNGTYLDVVAASKEWKDPRWLSSDDILAAKGKLMLRYGEHPSMIMNMHKYQPMAIEADHGSAQKFRPEIVCMYNAAQVIGLPAYEYGRISDRVQERRDNYENNTETPIYASQYTTTQYFKIQEQKGLSMAAVLEPVARYNLALATGTAYEAPSNVTAIAEKLARPKSVDEALKVIYHATVYTNKITNKGFVLERTDTMRRTVERDKERISHAAERASSYSR